MASLGRKRVDVERKYRLTLKTPDGSAADLTGATVAADLSAGPGAPSLRSLACLVEPPTAAGKVIVTVPPTTDLAPGTYSIFATATVAGVALDAASDETIDLVGGVDTATAATETIRGRVERVAVLECGPLMALVGMSTITGGGNPDLAPMIDWAYRGLRLTPADGLCPTDDELGATGRIVDLCELVIYRTLAAIRSRWTQVTTRVSQGQANASELRQDLDRRLAEMEKRPLIQRALDAAGESVAMGGVGMADLFPDYCWPGFGGCLP